MPRNYILQHVRKNGHPVATLLAIKLSDGSIGVSWSKVNRKIVNGKPLDTFNKKTAISECWRKVQKGDGIKWYNESSTFVYSFFMGDAKDIPFIFYRVEENGLSVYNNFLDRVAKYFKLNEKSPKVNESPVEYEYKLYYSNSNYSHSCNKFCISRKISNDNRIFGVTYYNHKDKCWDNDASNAWFEPYMLGKICEEINIVKLTILGY